MADKDSAGPDRNAKLTKTALPGYWALGPKKRAEMDKKVEEWAKKRDSGEDWKPYSGK